GGFASFSGGSVKVDTDSHIKSNDFHLLAGPGLRVNHGGNGKTDFGVFFEAGWGNYDAFNSFFRGDGDTRYHGGGLLLRHDTCFGLYGELSARAGAARSGYASGFDTDYDLKSAYYGGHIGIGHIFRPSEANAVDLFAKGLWTRLEADSDINRIGDRMHVDKTDSLRTQLGVKYSHNFGRSASVFVKTAWEYEHDGKTGGSYAGGVAIRKANMGGSSGLGEVGVDLRINDRASLGASVHGVVGARRGFGGNLSVSFGF
ncbi:MAG: autotransporter outer membrane beta-barrel domain-containing protein, partial [Planctomycetota bacterium]|nr:autotransporter outer membrane beta-barrel domain-containing protein [Planctomycetota bacterium]